MWYSTFKYLDTHYLVATGFSRFHTPFHTHTRRVLVLVFSATLVVVEVVTWYLVPGQGDLRYRRGRVRSYRKIIRTHIYQECKCTPGGLYCTAGRGRDGTAGGVYPVGVGCREQSPFLLL